MQCSQSKTIQFVQTATIIDPSWESCDHTFYTQRTIDQCDTPWVVSRRAQKLNSVLYTQQNGKLKRYLTCTSPLRHSTTNRARFVAACKIFFSFRHLVNFQIHSQTEMKTSIVYSGRAPPAIALLCDITTIQWPELTDFKQGIERLIWNGSEDGRQMILWGQCTSFHLQQTTMITSTCFTENECEAKSREIQFALQVYDQASRCVRRIWIRSAQRRRFAGLHRYGIRAISFSQK